MILLQIVYESVNKTLNICIKHPELYNNVSFPVLNKDEHLKTNKYFLVFKIFKKMFSAFKVDTERGGKKEKRENARGRKEKNTNILGVIQN